QLPDRSLHGSRGWTGDGLLRRGRESLPDHETRTRLILSTALRINVSSTAKLTASVPPIHLMLHITFATRIPIIIQGTESVGVSLSSSTNMSSAGAESATRARVFLLASPLWVDVQVPHLPRRDRRPAKYSSAPVARLVSTCSTNRCVASFAIATWPYGA